MCVKCYRAQNFGEKHPNWKGGRINSRGYVLVYKPNHPCARDGYVSEHRLVWEQHNHKLLPEGFIIHHLNGIKSDNRIENLLALSTKEHSRVLPETAKRIRELEAEINRIKNIT
jgi:hypothetical protein